MPAEYVPGLEGIVAAQTEISLVDGANGQLVYRGYVIADLAEDISFEEVAHLFWYGSLPSRAQLDGLAAQLSSVRFRELRLRGPGGRDLVGASKKDLPLIRLRPKD